MVERLLLSTLNRRAAQYVVNTVREIELAIVLGTRSVYTRFYANEHRVWCCAKINEGNEGRMNFGQSICNEEIVIIDSAYLDGGCKMWET